MKSKNILPVSILILLGLFIFTVGIALNYTYMDEVYFADPVINYLHGHGYTTSAWNQTRQSETHVSTAPAYSLLLLSWFKVFGISQTIARCLPATLALGSALVFWRASLRSGLITSGRAGAVLIGLVLMDYGYAFSYTCGRPDSLSALLVALMFYGVTLKNRQIATGLLCVIAILLPFVQWGCVLYVFFLSTALCFVLGKKLLRYFLPVFACLAAGLLIQRIAYGYLDLWDIWLKTISVSEGSESMAGRIAHRLSWDALLHHNSNTLPKDFSALIALAGVAALYFWSKFQRRPEGVLLARSAWIIAAVVGIGMYCAGKFPTYYGWMLGFPLAAIVGYYFDKSLAKGRLETAMAALMVIVACGAGLPLQAALASHDWKDRQPAAMAAWLGPQIKPEDVVYCDYPQYYIAKERARQVFAGFYFGSLTPEELNTITLVIVANNDSGWRQAVHPLDQSSIIGTWEPARSGILGNNWKYGILSAPNYGCTVYRLKEPSGQ